MIDSYKKVLGLMALLLGLLITWLFIQTKYPAFYSRLVHLTMAGDMAGLSTYISSFGYGAFLVSIGLLIFCNFFGLPTIPFLTINGALFGLVPGLVISFIGEVLGIEISFHVGRIFFRKEARKFIERKRMLKKIDKYSSVEHMAYARAIPYSPNILFTALAVLSKLTSKEHLKATIIGKIPSVAIEVFLGHDLIYFSQHWLRFCIIFLLVIGFYMGHKIYKKRKCASQNCEDED